MQWTVDKAVQWAQLAVLVVGLAVSATTCSRAFDRIESHEKRLAAIEDANKKAVDVAAQQKDLLQEKLGKIQSSTDYLNWRMDAVVKQLDKQAEGKKR